VRALLRGSRESFKIAFSRNNECAPQAMTNKLGLEEALRKLARSRRIPVSPDRSGGVKVRPAHRSNANEEFSDPPSADTALCVSILIILALIDFVAFRWL
jgi:hypothetical protein